MLTPDTAPWLDIPTQRLLTAGDPTHATLPAERRLLTAGVPARQLPREAASHTAIPARRPLRRRNNGLA